MPKRSELVKQAQSERDKARHAAATEILEQPTPPAEEIKSQRLALDPERPLPVYLTLARRLHERGGAALEIRRYVRQHWARSVVPSSPLKLSKFARRRGDDDR